MKPRIFVSSVSRELNAARQLVTNTLMALGYEPIWQDIFETSGQDIRPMLREKIDGCSAVLQIVGDAYGAESPLPDETFGRVSYTQYEALYAKAQGKKVYYLIAQSEMPRDATPETIDIPIDASAAARNDANERQALQRTYRDNLQSTEHIYYPIQSHAETELSVRRLKQELDKLRRRIQSWMIGVSSALLLIVVGVLVLNRGLWRQEAKIDQTKQAISQQAEELKKLTAEVDNPKRIREQLVRTIQRTYDAAVVEAEKISDWQKRDDAKQVAAAGRDQNLGRVDEFLKSIESVLHSGDASPEYLEMTRIFSDQGAEEAIAYIASRKQDLFAKFDRDQDLNRKMNLLPILESVRNEILIGRYQNAHETCDQLLSKDPNWGDALHEQFWITTELADRALRYESVSSSHRLYCKADEFANRLIQISPANMQSQRDLSVSQCRLGEVLLRMGQLREALVHYKLGLEISEELVALNPCNTQSQNDLLIWHSKLGDVLMQMGKSQESLVHYDSVLKIHEKFAAANPLDAHAQRDLSVSHTNIGNVLMQMGQSQKSRAHYDSGLRISEKLATGDPRNARAQRDLSISQAKLGDILLQMGQPKEALAHYELGLKVLEKLAASDPSDARTQRDLSSSHYDLGNALLQMGRSQETLAHYESGLKINGKLAAVDSRDSQAQRDLSISHHKLGEVLLQMEKPQEALAHFETGLKIREKLSARDQRDARAQGDLAVLHDGLGDALLQMGQSLGALDHYTRFLKISEKLAADNPGDASAQRSLSISNHKLGDVLRQMGQPQKALAYYETGQKISEKLAALDPRDAQAQRDLMVSHCELGSVYQQLNEIAKAKLSYQAGMAVLNQMILAGMNVEVSRKEKESLEQVIAECDPAETMK